MVVVIKSGKRLMSLCDSKRPSDELENLSVEKKHSGILGLTFQLLKSAPHAATVRRLAA